MNPKQSQPIRDIDDSAFSLDQPQITPEVPRAATGPFETLHKPENAAPQAPLPQAQTLPTENKPDSRPNPAPPQPSPPTQQPKGEAGNLPAKHLPQELADWISSTPQRNSGDMQRNITDQKKMGQVKSFFSFLAFVASIFAAAFLINGFVFQSYFVEGTSMTPTLQNSDRLIIEKVSRTAAHIQGKKYIPQRGQIVVLDSAIMGSNGHKEQLIKRVIGLPGETVLIADGTVTIKNKEFPEGFNANESLDLMLEDTYIAQAYEKTIPEGEIFVMGDNRVEGGSQDSRFFGPIKSEDIEGRLWARILPLDQAQLFAQFIKLRL